MTDWNDIVNRHGHVVWQTAWRMLASGNCVPPSHEATLNENRLLGFFGSRDQMAVCCIPWSEIDDIEIPYFVPESQEVTPLPIHFH